MKRVLVVHYSQSGQLSDIARRVAAPLEQDPSIDVVYANLEPQTPLPFPWPFVPFFDAFPECIYEDAEPNKPLDISSETEFDLVILAYQVWFLAPSLPVTAFLQSDDAKRLLAGKPVITLIACRDMWMMAHEKVKKRLNALDATLIDNIALTDEAGSWLSFFSTPLWVLTGNKGPFKFGIPKAGVAPHEIADSSRFGRAIASALHTQANLSQPVLQGLGAVNIRHRLIASETVGTRSFKAWGALFRLVGKRGCLARRCLVYLYVAFLFALIITVLPITTSIKRILEPLMSKRIARQKQYFSAPSGESRERVAEFMDNDQAKNSQEG